MRFELFEDGWDEQGQPAGPCRQSKLQYQSHVKLMRVLQGAMEERPAILEGSPKDSDGSAKVALIALDRSIAAWGELYRHFPAAQDDILDILVHLDRLRRQVEREFPDARAFVRPGFDEEV